MVKGMALEVRDHPKILLPLCYKLIQSVGAGL